MEETEGIRGVKKVTSILNVKNIQGVDGGLEVKPMVEGGTVPLTPGEFDGLRQRAMSWNVYDGTYVTRDGKGTALAIVLQDDIETDDIVPIYYRLENIVQKHQGPEEFFISGPTVVEALQGHYMIKDLELLVPLVLVVLLASLFVFFRSIQGMLLPLLGVALSCSWTMGLMALLGIPLTMVTTALPVALMAVSSAYGIHVLENVFSDAHDGSGGKAGIIRALERVRLPVIMAGLTTIASFLSLCTTPIVPITQFGVLCAFGIGSTLILSLTFIPAVLSILDSAGRVHVSHHHTRRDLVGPMLRWLERVTITKSWYILAWSGILLVISVFGAFYVKSDLNLIEDFRKDSPIRIADEILNIRYIKDTSADMAQAGQLIHRLGDRVGFAMRRDDLATVEDQSGDEQERNGHGHYEDGDRAAPVSAPHRVPRKRSIGSENREVMVVDVGIPIPVTSESRRVHVAVTFTSASAAKPVVSTSTLRGAHR